MDDRTLTPTALVVGIRFRPAGPVYDFDPGPLVLLVDDRVVVDTERGPALGTVAVPPRHRPTARALHRVVKKADSRDLAREDAAHQREREYHRVALERIADLGLPLKLVRADSALDGGKATFFVASEEKVDVRGLARDLGAVLRVRIEVKQLGSRDAAKLAGGVGVCGRELCCSSWLKEFAPVSVKMVKAQGLSLNPSKLAGQCGRLKCCMRYEWETYVDLRRGLPAVGSTVQSVHGEGTVVAQHVLKQTVVLRRTEDGVPVEAGLDDLVAPRKADG